MFEQLKLEALDAQDYDKYGEVFYCFKHALGERIDYNLKLILQKLGIEKFRFDSDLEKQFPPEEFDQCYIENQSEWMNQQLPQFLTKDLAKQIFQETLKLKQELIEYEQQRLQREVDPDN